LLRHAALGGCDSQPKATAINPNNANTREYLGEAWLTKGRADLAQAELIKIDRHLWSVPRYCVTTFEMSERGSRYAHETRSK